MTRPNLAGELGSGINAGFPAHVSIMGQRFTLVDGAGEKEGVETFDPKLGPYLDCVIVDVNKNVSRMYYIDSNFDPDQPAAPDCWADNGLAPSVNAARPQARECGTCPKAEWGSATSKVTGKGIPACKSYKKMAILIPGQGEVFMLAVPPASLKAAQAYSQKVAGYKLDLCDIVTRVSFQAGTLGTLVFDAVGHADAEQKAMVDRIWEAGGCPQIVGRNDQPRLAPPTSGNGAALQAVLQAVEAPAPLTMGGSDFLAEQAKLVKLVKQAEQAKLAELAEQAEQAEQAKKPRGRSRTVAPAPKDALEAPFKNAQGQVAQFPRGQAGQQVPDPGQEKFGIAKDAPEPNAALSSQLEALFSTKFGN